MKIALAISFAAIFALTNTAYILRQWSGGVPKLWPVFANQFIACSIALLVMVTVT